MYKLLLATDQDHVVSFFRDNVDWHRMGYHHPYIVSNAQEAVAALESKAIDAVGWLLPKEESQKLNRYLRYGRPSMPVFDVKEDGEEQTAILRELLRVMDKLHGDYYDEYYDPETVMTQVRDDFIHDLLAGQITDYHYAERVMDYLRSRVDPKKNLILYDIDMPQGEVYMSERQDPVLRQSRLEAALRNNFFGHYVDGVCYGVAVLGPRHIRVAAIPVEGSDEGIDAFRTRVAGHVDQTLDMVKSYLELDMNIAGVQVLENIRELVDF